MLNDFDLTGKKVLITGAGRGIGKGIAFAMAEAGADVAVTSLGGDTALSSEAIAQVSDEMAKKFATEKETPYTRWVRDEGLDIISSFYVPNLHTVELKPEVVMEPGSLMALHHEDERIPLP